MNYPKRLIEVNLPIKRISEHARREKSIRHGHISTLHIWWARRPLAACRAVICAALWPDPADPQCPQVFRDMAADLITTFAKKAATSKLMETCSKDSMKRWMQIGRASPISHPTSGNDLIILRNALLDFISDFANWDNSIVKEYLDTSRALTQVAHEALGGEPGTRPLVVDPFAGGGAMPLEALRVGADSFASDLNPIAALLNKITQEYVPRWGENLISSVAEWGGWLRKRAEKELAKLYPKDKDGSSAIGFLWARTIFCEGPGCGVEIPIIKSPVFSTRKGSEAGVTIAYRDGRLITQVVHGSAVLKLRDGTSKRSSVTCPKCGFTTRRARVAAQANDRGFGHHMLAVAVMKPKGDRCYRQPTEEDHAVLKGIEQGLKTWATKDFTGIPAIPKEELPYLRSIFNVRVYGIDEWQKLFTPRQLLSALTFVQLVREGAQQIKTSVQDSGLASAIVECLALSVSNSLQYQCNIATYLTEGIKSAFIQGQSLPMKLDYIEANPLIQNLAGGYDYSLEQHLSGLRYVGSYPFHQGVVGQLSALDITMPEGSVDLLATDPPYYDVVPYADCSDFFYVWLHRMLHGVTSFPTESELTPKDEEIVQLAERNVRYRVRTKKWFEEKLCEAFSLAAKYTKPSGVSIIVFAHKETAAWEALLRSVLDAGWVVTGSWPIDTEKGSRLRANESAVLGSSIHLVCRPHEQGAVKVGDWRNVLAELPSRMHAWVPRLAHEGVVGADAIFACLGPAIEIFSRYSRVEKASGEQVTLKEYLEHVWAAVAKEALNMIFEGADATGFEEDARLTAMWLWTLSTNANGLAEKEQEESSEDENEGESKSKKPKGGFMLKYDAARKIAQGLGAHLEKLTSLVEAKGETARLLPVTERARYLFGKNVEETSRQRRKKEHQLDFFKIIEEAETTAPKKGIYTPSESGRTVLDRVHQSMLLFAAARGEALRRFLVEDGVGRDQRFWKLAQSLSALYPKTTDEKRWVDGVLARKKGLGL